MSGRCNSDYEKTCARLRDVSDYTDGFHLGCNELEVSDENNNDHTFACYSNSALAIMRGPVCSFTGRMRGRILR